VCSFEPEAARAGAVSRHAARRPLQPAPCNLLSCPESNADSGEESEEYFDLTDDDDVSSFRHVGTQTGCAPPPPCVLPQPALQQQPTKKRRIRLNGLASYTVRAPPQRRIFLALYSRYCGVFRVKVSQYQDFMCKTSIIWDSRVLTVVLNRAEGRIGGQTAGIPQGGHVHSVCAQGSAVPAVQDPAQSDGGVCNAVYYNVFRRLFWRCGFLRQRVSCSCAVSAISTHR